MSSHLPVIAEGTPTTVITHFKLIWLFKVANFDLLINLFLAYVLILYPLKTPENLWFSSVFREYKMKTLVKNG